MVTINPSTFADWPALLCLLHAAFAKMDGRINPPSSVLAMDSEDLCRKAAREDLFLIQRSGQPIGCLNARAETDAYCIGKLAVAPDRQGEGHARATSFTFRRDLSPLPLSPTRAMP